MVLNKNEKYNYFTGDILRKTVCEINKCNGCMACVDICSKEAISIQDTLFAYNGIINENQCVNCNLCHNVCPNNIPVKKEPPIEWHQGWAKSNQIRAKASSGGVASAIIKSFINNGGYVASCFLKNGEFRFELTNDLVISKQFTGSRYVKSNPCGIYRDIKNKLKENERVLFIGLPCQVAGLKNYIGNSENLYTIDLICHGSPSPKVLESFLNEYGYCLSELIDVQFRTKTEFEIKENDSRITLDIVMDDYLIAFLNCVVYTENCYSCDYAKVQRVSDITLGDSWGTELKNEEKKGVSLILCQNQKGHELVDKADLELFDVDLNYAIEHNRQLKGPSTKHSGRYKFLYMLSKGKRFRYVAFRIMTKSIIRQKIKFILLKFHILNKEGGYRTTLILDNKVSR